MATKSRRSLISLNDVPEYREATAKLQKLGKAIADTEAEIQELDHDDPEAQAEKLLAGESLESMDSKRQHAETLNHRLEVLKVAEAKQHELTRRGVGEVRRRAERTLRETAAPLQVEIVEELVDAYERVAAAEERQQDFRHYFYENDVVYAEPLVDFSPPPVMSVDSIQTRLSELRIILKELKQ
ncbi:MAG: hypothetical protein AAGJ46_06625 [Planctomycetota bacterium]